MSKKKKKKIHYPLCQTYSPTFPEWEIFVNAPMFWTQLDHTSRGEVVLCMHGKKEVQNTPDGINGVDLLCNVQK